MTPIGALTHAGRSLSSPSATSSTLSATMMRHSFRRHYCRSENSREDIFRHVANHHRRLGHAGAPVRTRVRPTPHSSGSSCTCWENRRPQLLPGRRTAAVYTGGRGHRWIVPGIQLPCRLSLGYVWVIHMCWYRLSSPLPLQVFLRRGGQVLHSQERQAFLPPREPITATVTPPQQYRGNRDTIALGIPHELPEASAERRNVPKKEYFWGNC